MSKDSISLRQARSNLEDGLVFARYLDVAADGFFRLMLGSAAGRVIAEAYQSRGHDLSYEHVTFAEQDGGIVGMTSAFTAAQHAASSDRPLHKAAGLRVVRMWAIAAFARRLLAFMHDVPDGDCYLQAVAVDESVRGAGLGSLLIDAVESRALEGGCRRLALDVAAENVAARRLYERRGMAVVAESPAPPFQPDARALRMVKQL